MVYNKHENYRKIAIYLKSDFLLTGKMFFLIFKNIGFLGHSYNMNLNNYFELFLIVLVMENVLFKFIKQL